MERNDLQWWSGLALLVAGTAVLFASLVFWGRGLPVLALAVLALVAGALMVAWSRRGRPV